MTIATWLQECMPHLPSTACEDMTDACQHSLKKWRGLTPENLEKHGIVKKRHTHYLYQEGGEGRAPSLSINCESCALCLYAMNQHAQNKLEGDSTGSFCHYCPIVEVYGRTCDGTSVFDEDTVVNEESEYSAFRESSNPFPMIHMLENTLAFLQDEELPHELIVSELE